jgi:hypothetical protein
MGTGVYKWPTELAASIAVKALLMSTFDETLICTVDEAVKAIYQKVISALEIGIILIHAV